MKQFTIKFSDDDNALLEKAIKTIGISRTAFLRSLGLKEARKILFDLNISVDKAPQTPVL
jgi:uncharacterized protein (DUF1778 family)